MERLHRLFTNGDKFFKTFLDSQNIPHEYNESIVGKTVLLLISESDPNWPLISDYLRAYPIVHMVEAKYSKKEVDDAAWCTLCGTSHFGYPQPEEDFGYKHVTYDNGGCISCGIGFRQIAPFRFRKQPTMRHSKIIQLNWVFDEYFVTQEARSQLEASELTGLGFDEVLLHRSGNSIQTWSQMLVSQTLPPILRTSALALEACPACRQTKFNNPMGEQFVLAKPIPESTPDIIRSVEWFGSGSSAHRLVIVSKRFVQFARSNNWRGLHFAPIISPTAA